MDTSVNVRATEHRGRAPRRWAAVAGVSTVLAVAGTAVGALPAVAASELPAECVPAAAGSPTVVCTYGPGAHSFVPPAGVGTVSLRVIGAAGGRGGDYTGLGGPVYGAPGGPGGLVTADKVPVPAGGLALMVGVHGTDGARGVRPGAAAGGTGGTGGPGRGGNGGSTTVAPGTEAQGGGAGGGGGGASSVSANGALIAVAGAGGGGGAAGAIGTSGYYGTGNGGFGGAANQDGDRSYPAPSSGGPYGGKAGANGGPDGADAGATVETGFGGNGAAGGGGGGLLGGAAGDTSGGGGGGGGTSKVPAGGTSVDPWTNGDGSITITYTLAPTAGAIAATSGDRLSAPAGRAFGQPLTATVVDPTQANAPVPGAAVTFTVTSGTASFGGSPSAPATTGSDGRAISPTLTAGTTLGSVTVTATTTKPGGGPLSVSFIETVTSAAANVTGNGGFTGSDGTRYTLIADAHAAANGTPSGRVVLTGGQNTFASRSVTSVVRQGSSATVTGTAALATGATVPFTLTVTDGPGGRDQISVVVNGRTVSGTLSSGDITLS